MFGAVFGETDGVAPGYKGSLDWRRLGLYSESEYVVDTGDTSNSFLYNWSEFTVSPTDALRVGLVVQRTRAYRTDRDVQRGAVENAAEPFGQRVEHLSSCLLGLVIAGRTGNSCSRNRRQTPLRPRAHRAVGR